MNIPTVLIDTQQSNKKVTQALQSVLISTYCLHLATHNYHWNVEGANFVPLHGLFEKQYNEQFKALDAIAERIRALGTYALPFEEENITEIFKVIANPIKKESNADPRANMMVQNLVVLTNAVIKRCQSAKDAAIDTQDDETENLMVERITAHQKAIWMLESTAK